MNHLQNILNDVVMATGNVQNCAIIKRKEYTVKAASLGFVLSEESVQKVVDVFNKPWELNETGLQFNGELYSPCRADKESIYANNNNKGIILVKTQLYIILAMYIDTMSPAVCVEATEKLGDYFKEKGK